MQIEIKFDTYLGLCCLHNSSKKEKEEEKITLL